jgi:hypothetical protein
MNDKFIISHPKRRKKEMGWESRKDEGKKG